MKIEPVIVIDSREQCPLVFDTMPTEVGCLNTGDYSVKYLSHLITVERKSLDDLLACVGRERSRFKNELQRLQAYRFRLLVVEADAAALEAGEWRSRLTRAHVLGSLATWQAQYGLPVWLAGSHEAAGRFVERFLYQAACCVATDYRAAARFVETATGRQERLDRVSVT